MQCPRCQRENPAAQKFCGECGTPIAGAAPNAGPYTELNDEIESLKSSLSDALEQQTATSEILRVISSSPVDLQPVLDTVVASAARYCSAHDATLLHLDGGSLRLAAHYGPIPVPVGRPIPVVRGTTSGRAVLERRAVHVADIQAEAEEFPESRAFAKELGYRTQLSVPLLREGAAIGTIVLRRVEMNPFTDKQIALLQTFADQAVIAIENVRLFNETKEALERQTATSEILRVISQSPTDTQPVFDAIAENTARLCSVEDVFIVLVAGDSLRAVAATGQLTGLIPDYNARRVPVSRTSVAGRVIVDRTTIHIDDLAAVPENELPDGRALQRMFNHRTILATPLLREGAALGAIVVFRLEVRPFSERQQDLLQTFADQAVIAIENVRLFKELEQRNRDLTDSLEQQTATSEILQVISSSPTDIQPVFAAVATRAARLCDAFDAAIHRIDGDVLRLVAHDGPIEPDTILPIGQGTFAGHVVREQRAMHVADLQAEEDAYPLSAQFARNRGFRTILSVPMLRGTEALGVITIRRAEVRPFTERQAKLLQTFADQAVIAIENVRLFKELEARNRDISESLEQQTASADILRVISSSPNNLEPVFSTILTHATRLCSAQLALLFRYDGGLFELLAHIGDEKAATFAAVAFPRGPFSASPTTGLGRVARELQPVQIQDLTQDPAYAEREPLRVMSVEIGGVRTWLGVPLLKEEKMVGALVMWRREVHPFVDRQIALVSSFADQAVIAIENVRLFTELQEKNRALTEAHAQVTESLERQTATSDVLRVISQSPTDVQPVFDAIVRSGAALCHAPDVIILIADRGSLHIAASVGPVAASVRQSRVFQGGGLPLTRGSVSGRAVIDRCTIHVHDVRAMPEDEFPEGMVLQREYGGHGTTLSVPLLLDDVSLGAITLLRNEVRPFTDRQVALLETFANQAVIAIENVRLFNETKEALEQQTATSEVLRAINRAHTDAQPVFDIIAASALRLCGAVFSAMVLYDGEILRLVAIQNAQPEGAEALRNVFPRPLDEGSATSRAIRSRAVVNIPDVFKDPHFAYGSVARAANYRSVLAVPMMRDGEPVGVILATRPEAGPFSTKETELLRTFADQAVIAIENVRLFTELQARTQELTRSVGQLTALGEVGRAVSSTLDVETVLSTIVSRAIQLSGTDGGSVYEYDEATEEFSLRASRDLPEAYVEQVRDARPRKGEGAVGRVAQTREPVQIADISDPAAYESRVRSMLLQMGLRALLAVPLIAEDRLVGALIVIRKRTGTFAAEEVTLLQTFATQSALAIQNARLFREIEVKSRQLEVASQHKSEFLANMSHELRTPLNAIIGFSEVLTDRMFGELNEKQEEYLKDIYASGTHLLSLINDILDLSKIEAGRMELELTDFHLPTALDNALTLVRERAGRRNITLQMSVDERLGEVQADERKIRQVVLNLLSNAIKFTPEGGRIEVGAVPKDGFVEVSVRDTGVGIAPEDQEKVFEEFQQVGTADKKAEGTGLGLTLCRKFIELHGGRIHVKSQVGVGSTFTFMIPVRRGE
jgi:GAF domain-containing protein